MEHCLDAGDDLIMATILTKLSSFTNAVFSGIYTDILVAVLILLVGFIIGKVLFKLLHRALAEVELSRMLKKAGVTLNIESGIASFAQYLAYFITIIMALNQLNIITTVLQMIVGGVVIILVISVALALKDFVPNAIACLYIFKNKFVDIGDIVRVKGVEGKVVQITLIETKLETNDGNTMLIPNAVLVKTEVVKVGSKRQRAKRH